MWHSRANISATVRSALYALRGGFLVRPFLIAFIMGVLGAVLSSLEEEFFWVQAAIPRTLFPSNADPQVAQVILSTIATGTMTVVSIVFAILLMTLTLASTQFSPRILASFVRDHVTQWTLGVFLGTFSYCIAALPAARSLPHPFVPVVTVAGAMALAPVCVGWLIYFIHHISNAISVNTIIDRIRRDTELVIDELMPYPRSSFQSYEGEHTFGEPPAFSVVSRASGYIRYVDIERLRMLGKRYGFGIRLERRVGQFISEGVTVMRVTRGDRVTSEALQGMLAAVEIGPSRTMQQDLEFGVVQIVDIALRAISPAVNDPTTAITCVDQLSCILIRWLSRAPARSHYYDPPHVLRLVIPWIKLEGLLDLAFEQIRHYAAADAAVSLRLMRALGDIASTQSDRAIQKLLLERGQRVIQGCAPLLPEDELKRLERRLVVLASHSEV
ncbi:MAG: DUF2254 domain-containing protein [Rhodomicrobium sp.]